MNWKEINKKYPKAFDLFFEWFKGDPKAGVTKKEFLEVNDIVIMYGNLRELYDFFDEQGMYVNVRADSIFGQGEYVNLWMWEITTTKEGYVGILEHGNLHLSDFSRTEIEEIAFEKAFEILEEKLK